MARRRQAQHAGKIAQAPAVTSAAADQVDRVQFLTRIGVAILLIATVALVCYVRLRLVGVPLERDEGEYAHAGQLILKGTPPYQAAYNMKFPGVYYAYAGIMTVFGQSPAGIRLGLLLVHVATAGLLFAWGRRVAGELAAGVGTAVFMLLALDRWTMGIFAHATHFVMFFVIAAFAVMQDGRRAWRLLTSGTLLGLAIVMKQQAAVFPMLGIALSMWPSTALGSGPSTAPGPGGVSRLGEALRRGALVVAGIAIALVALVVSLVLTGEFGQFWHWTLSYAAAYVSVVPASMATTVFGMAWGYVTQATGWWWYLGLIGAVLLFVTKWSRESRIALAGALLAAALSIVPGYFFRPHYFILAMPIVGLLAGVAIASVDRVLARSLSPVRARIIAFALFTAIAGLQIARDGHFFFGMNATELVRAVYQNNPFLEAPEISRYLAAHTGAGDRIAVLGSEPEILFYANRPSATGYIYMYPLTERQPFAEEMRQEMIQQVQSARPEYVVLVDVPGSWVATLYPDTRLVTWANSFTSTCYERAGIIDIDPAGPATIRWDADAVGYQARSQSKVTVFRRIGGAGCGGTTS